MINPNQFIFYVEKPLESALFYEKIFLKNLYYQPQIMLVFLLKMGFTLVYGVPKQKILFQAVLEIALSLLMW